MVFRLERSSSLTPLVGLGVRSIDDQALLDLLGHLPKALLNHAQLVIRATEATEPRQLPRFVSGLPLVTPAAWPANELPRGAPLPPGSVVYLPHGWTVQGEGHRWRLAPVAERPHVEEMGRGKHEQRSREQRSREQSRHVPLAEEPLAEEPLPEEPLAVEPLAEEPSGSRLQASPLDSITPDSHDDSLDAFFIDIARIAGRSGVGVLTAGCASAGRLGLRVLAEAGGLTMLEIPLGSDCHAGQAAGEVLPFCVDYRDRADRLAEELRAYLEHLRQLHRKTDGGGLQHEIAAAFPEIAQRLHERTSHAFYGYKTSTITRRVRRRMQVLRIDSFSDYLQRFHSKPDEADALFSELLIGVTQFFRDPPVFRTVESEIIPQLFTPPTEGEEGSGQGRTAAPRKLRVWVPGCSTGQEAYSLAMLLAEEAERRNSSAEIEILATDIDRCALEEARQGIYPRGIEREIPAARLKRFFRLRGGQYQVSESLRKLCRFSLHNVISDPPFARLDMISCRNLLTYLRPHLQKKLIPVFHQALRPQGFLLFGLSESTRTHTHLFHPIHPRQRIARRKACHVGTSHPGKGHAGKGLSTNSGHLSERDRHFGGPARYRVEAGEPPEPKQSGQAPTAQERIAELEQELQSTRADLERTRLAIDAGGFGYWHWEIGSNQLYFSRLQRQLFGLPETGPITVRDFKSCVHPEDLGRMQRHIQEAMSCRTRYEDEYRVVHSDGSIRWLLVRGSLLFSGGLDSRPLRAMGIALDVTDRKLVEESLLQAQAQAEAANKSKSEFLANMSHEIRTPMTAILGYADLVAEHLSDPMALKQVETIRRNGTFLLDIINDILDLSKIDAGKLIIRRQRCDVGQLITEICALMEVRVQEKGLELIVDFENQIPQTIETDPTRLRQVLVNLIGNAIKFTEYGMIEVVVRYLDAQQQLEIDVIDTGIGIGEKEQAGLFAPFMQVDTSINRQFGGTGLGLAITRRLAEMLGGEVRLESKLGEGSRFTVAIATGPLEGIPRISPILTISREESRVGSRGTVNARILVVDDSRDIRVLASTLLKRSGAMVTTVDGGAAAVEAVIRADAAGEPFGLVLMDVQMPGLDGPAAVEQLRKAGYTLPIVAVTANAMQGDRERCLRRGYNDYLSKPLDVHSLNATIEKYLRT